MLLGSRSSSALSIFLTEVDSAWPSVPDIFESYIPLVSSFKAFSCLLSSFNPPSTVFNYEVSLPKALLATAYAGTNDSYFSFSSVSWFYSF